MIPFEVPLMEAQGQFFGPAHLQAVDNLKYLQAVLSRYPTDRIILTVNSSYVNLYRAVENGKFRRSKTGMVPGDRIELSTHGFSVRCSTN